MSLAVDRYDADEIREALMDLAHHQSLARARRAFEKRRGYAPTVQTIKAWREKHIDVWAECQQQLQREISPRHADQAEALVTQFLDTNRELIERFAEALENSEIPPRELPAAIQKIAVAAGQTNEKIISPARGRPTQIIEHKEPTELYERLGELLADLPQSGPVLDAEVVEDPALQESTGG